MAREAQEAGLVFDVPLLTHYVNSGSDPIRHNPVNQMYEVDNLILGAKMKPSIKKRASAFSGGLRRLTNERALSVRVASSAVPISRSVGTSRPISRLSPARPTDSRISLNQSSRFRRTVST